MSWSLHNCSGVREEVKEKVKQQVNPDSYTDPETKLEFADAQAGILALIDSTASTHVSVSGHGSRRGSVSVSISVWNEEKA